MALKICFLSVIHTYNDTRIFVKEARSLAKAGFEVIHLAAGNLHSHVVDDVKIEIYSSITQNGFIGRLLKPIPLLVRALKINADCYHCNEIESWIVGCFIKILRPSKIVIFDVHEHYPSFFDNPFYPKWVGKIGKLMTLLLYRSLVHLTNYFIFVLPSLALDFINIDSKYIVVANHALLPNHEPSKNTVSETIKSQFAGHKTAIHTGRISRLRGWPQILDAISTMKINDLHVLFLGDLSERDEIMAESERLGIATRIHMIDSVPHQLMLEYLQCADIGLIQYIPDVHNHVIAWPSKFCDYMQASLPVIAPQTMESVADVIVNDKVGLLVDPNHPEQLADALDYLCLNEEVAKIMGENGRQAVLTKYNWELEAKKLIDLYTNISKEMRSLGNDN